jgi:hypothetical protein
VTVSGLYTSLQKRLVDKPSSEHAVCMTNERAASHHAKWMSGSKKVEI